MIRVCMALSGLAILACGASLSHGAEPKPPSAEQLFVMKVLPVLQAKCFSCHGNDPKDISGRLDLRSRAGVLRGGDSGQPVVVAGKPDESWLYIAVTRENADLVMPPKENDKLQPTEVEAIRRWITDGAPWPSQLRIDEQRKNASWTRAAGSRSLGGR
jgi:hypothetical protein